ncbi:MAG: globin, partial [Anaerolineae bacterium]|nr:globin [Anaerolineae bacterium]
RHLGKQLTEAQRSRWASLIAACADEAGLPDDPEFRSAFVAYIEWGSRLAVINSQPGASVNPEAPMPKWGWGEVGGPYIAR